MNQPLYDVFDIDQNKVIIHEADSQSISDQIGINKYTVSGYAQHRTQYQRRYVFTMVSEPELRPKSNKQINDIKLQFDNAMMALRTNYPPERLSRIQFVCKV